jgi:hypothetical protein
MELGGVRWLILGKQLSCIANFNQFKMGFLRRKILMTFFSLFHLVWCLMRIFGDLFKDFIQRSWLHKVYRIDHLWINYVHWNSYLCSQWVSWVKVESNLNPSKVTNRSKNRSSLINRNYCSRNKIVLMYRLNHVEYWSNPNLAGLSRVELTICCLGWGKYWLWRERKDFCNLSDCWKSMMKIVMVEFLLSNSNECFMIKK